MSDETTRPEDEVEAHGGLGLEDPTAADPLMGATEDDEPDVEAHGGLGLEDPTAADPTAADPSMM